MNIWDLMDERFGKDNVLALATLEDGLPAVRCVNAYYECGAFYIITYALSGKMGQLAACPQAALAGEWFTGRGDRRKPGLVPQAGKRRHRGKAARCLLPMDRQRSQQFCG